MIDVPSYATDDYSKQLLIDTEPVFVKIATKVCANLNYEFIKIELKEGLINKDHEGWFFAYTDDIWVRGGLGITNYSSGVFYLLHYKDENGLTLSKPLDLALIELRNLALIEFKKRLNYD